jgi:hypothetical protein
MAKLISAFLQLVANTPKTPLPGKGLDNFLPPGLQATTLSQHHVENLCFAWQLRSFLKECTKKCFVEYRLQRSSN